MPGVRKRTFTLTKQGEGALDKLRNEFTKARQDFMKQLSNDPTEVANMKRAGITDLEIIEMQGSGKVPDDFQVHHKQPLSLGGSNGPENLILIENDPYHLALTNAQTWLIEKLSPGQTVQFDFPVPPGKVYVQPPT